MDPDGDGASNLEEFAAGTDPQDAADALTLRALVVGDQVRLEFSAKSNKTYSVQFKESLSEGPWTVIADVPTAASNRVAVVWGPVSDDARASVPGDGAATTAASPRAGGVAVAGIRGGGLRADATLRVIAAGHGN